MTTKELIAEIWNAYNNAIETGVLQPIIILCIDGSSEIGTAIAQLHPVTPLSGNSSVTPWEADTAYLQAWTLDHFLTAMTILEAPRQIVADFAGKLAVVPSGSHFWVVGYTEDSVPLCFPMDVPNPCPQRITAAVPSRSERELNQDSAAVFYQLGKGIRTSVILPSLSKALGREIKEAKKERRRKRSIHKPTNQPSTIKAWCAFIEEVRRKYPHLTDSELAKGLTLQDESTDEIHEIIKKVNLYRRIRNEFMTDPDWDADGMAESMCHNPNMAETFLNMKVFAPERDSDSR